MVTIFDDHPCQLGEGPTYDPELDCLWWFDIEGKCLFEHQFGNRSTHRHRLPKMASMLGVIDEHSQLIAFEDGLYLRDRLSKDVTLLKPLEADLPTNRSNDGRVHPSGALWVGTMSKSSEKQAGAIYWFFKGELKLLFPDITVPNAICFSPDGEIGYFTDTPTRHLMRVQLDPSNGLPVKEPELFYRHEDLPGWQDGAVTDRRGNIWNACWQGSCVIQLSDQGEKLKMFPVPALQPTCPVFVGKNLDSMLVTSAWTGIRNHKAGEEGADGKTHRLDIKVDGKAEPRIVL